MCYKANIQSNVKVSLVQYWHVFCLSLYWTTVSAIGVVHRLISSVSIEQSSMLWDILEKKHKEYPMLTLQEKRGSNTWIINSMSLHQVCMWKEQGTLNLALDTKSDLIPVRKGWVTGSFGQLLRLLYKIYMHFASNEIKHRKMLF